MHYRELKSGMKVTITNTTSGFVMIATFSHFSRSPVDALIFTLEDGSRYTMFLGEYSSWFEVEKVLV